MEEYKQLSPNQWRALLVEFFTIGPPNDGGEERQAQLVRIVQDSKAKAHHSFVINTQELIDHAPKYSMMILRHPDVLLNLCNQALVEAQQGLMKSPLMKQKHKELLESGHEGYSVKQEATVRLTNLPAFREFCKPNISSIRASDVGGLVQICGTVIRTGQVKMLEYMHEYQCASQRCGHTFVVAADMEQGNLMEEPKVCPMVGRNPPCKSSKFTMLGSKCTDYQEIKIQEHVQKLEIGSIPRSIVVLLEHDLVDRCKAGDDVVIVGRLMRRWRPVFREVRCNIELVLRANSVRVCNVSENAAVLGISKDTQSEFERMWEYAYSHHTPLAARDYVIRAVCPQIFGLFTVKLSLLLTLIGGVEQVDQKGMRVRAQSHLLIVGDPGTGKSQFLRFAAKLSPRSVLTTGVGTTSAGLTCSAVKDSGEWNLEAGALVLADRGVCCIDEFSSIREHDRATIHEAMEQQSLSVAKAGLVCKLNARATVIAVTNPKGTYDVTEDVSVNTAIASPLLSRFDIVLVLLDTSNEDWDRVVSTFILREACGVVKAAGSEDGGPHAKRARLTHHREKEGDVSSSSRAAFSFLHDRSSAPWGLEKLQKYVAYVRETCRPRLTEKASTVLRRYWELQRMNSHRNVARTTVRMLESLVRLAQAHARLMFRQEVIVMDAIIAVHSVEMSMMTSSLLELDSALHSDFPLNPDEQYATFERIVLDKLGLFGVNQPQDET